MAHGQQFPLRAPGDEKMLQEQITLVRIKARLITILHWGVQLHLLQYYMGVSQIIIVIGMVVVVVVGWG